MASTSDIRKGMCIELSSDIFIIIDFQHVKPGKGNAFVRTKLKSLTTGKVIDNTFPAGHKVNDVRVERRTFQFLYNDGAFLNFMDNDTFDQVQLSPEMVGSPELIKEGESVQIIFHAEKNVPLTCELPQYVYLKVTYIEPGIKGDTATNTLTPAVVETGANVRVPLFIKEGDLIKIDTETGTYMERAKQ